jgi:hypothetical protein
MANKKHRNGTSGARAPSLAWRLAHAASGATCSRLARIAVLVLFALAVVYVAFW